MAWGLTTILCDYSYYMVVYSISAGEISTYWLYLSSLIAFAPDYMGNVKLRCCVWRNMIGEEKWRIFIHVNKQKLLFYISNHSLHFDFSTYIEYYCPTIWAILKELNFIMTWECTVLRTMQNFAFLCVEIEFLWWRCLNS